MSSRFAIRGVPRARPAISRRALGARAGRRGCAAARSRIATRSLGLVVVEPGDEAEAVAQRAGDQAGAGGRADEGEARAGRGGSSAPTGPCRSRCRAGSPPSPGRAPPRPARGRRWISSMNSTSPSSRLVRIAARSPARSSAGPLVIAQRDVELGGDDAGEATSCRGPAGRRTAGGRRAWPRWRAAPSRISRCSFRRGWPTNSSRRRGPERGLLGPLRPGRPPGCSSSSLTSRSPSSPSTAHRRDRQQLERVAQQVLDRAVVGQLARARSRTSSGCVAEPGRARRGPRRAVDAAPSSGSTRSSVGDARGAPCSSTSSRCAVRFPTPGTSVSASRSSSSRRAPQRARRVHREDRQRELRARRRSRRCSTSNVSRSSRVGNP